MLQVVNLNEKLVEDLANELKEQKKDSAMCYCDVCIADIMTLTLNELKPRYVASPLTETFFKPSSSRKEQVEGIRSVFEKATEKVKHSPRH